MTLNREVFFRDPTTFTIPNDGVAKILDPHSPEEWAVLRYELEFFVCEGEYRRGLERILSTYLANLDKPEQPAVWISGFYGSGKSLLVRVLEYLWRDIEFPDGARARSIVKLPNDINDLFKEISTAGKRLGGLWSAGGTLGAAAGNNVRLALLGILFKSAGLPEKYAPATFVIWLMKNGYYDVFKREVEQQGQDLNSELYELYVSPVVTNALLKAFPGFASTPAAARSLLKEQFANRDDVSDDELFKTMEDVLRLKSTSADKLPCTLLVFDELQQFIGEDPARTLAVQNVVEACSSRFGSRLLFVATGQAALQATPQLQKLQGRFTVSVMLSDTDVERVVRDVVLRKKPTQVAELKEMLDTMSGEIERHLVGTKIGPEPADSRELVSDYPLLPTRRRFWERVLRAVDNAGMAGQLRTQLRIVHEANRGIANESLGTVVAGDLIYNQLSGDMLQSGVLLRDIATMIARQDDGTPDGKLRSRLCALIFLIGKLPSEGVAQTGVKATADTLADLLVENLPAGSSDLRQRIPALLQSLADDGTVMLVGDEYRLQTRESAEWEGDFRKRHTRLLADDTRLASDRATTFRNALGVLLKGITLTQGASKTPRRFELIFGYVTPQKNSGTVPVWVRDEWSVSEKAVRDEAIAAGQESPIVYVFLPRWEADQLKNALARFAAAEETIHQRPTPTTPGGVEARAAMESRRTMEKSQLDGLVLGAIGNAKVFQGGGNEVIEGSIIESVKSAVDAALVRLFPKFKFADFSNWGTVLKRASEGAADALSAIGYNGDADKYYTCLEIRSFIGGAGKKGTEVRKQFTGEGYGWPQDAVDASLFVLVAGGFVRAMKNGQPIALKQIPQNQIGGIDFYSEGVTVTAPQRIAVRKLLSEMGVQCKTGEESEVLASALERLIGLANSAGGEPPLTARPSTANIEQLRALGGNEQLVAAANRCTELVNNYKEWTNAQKQIAERKPRWDTLQELMRHASTLSIAAEVKPQVEAISFGRTLLTDTDQVPPLTSALTNALRQAVQTSRQRLVDERNRQVSALEASAEWQKLSESDRARILSGNTLEPIAEINVSSGDTLLRTLDAMSLAYWDDKIAGLPSRVARAREQAGKLLEPQAVYVHPRPATLRKPEEVDEYLADLRAEIIKEIDAGKPVILQ